LAVFNLIPIPPLDGSKILFAILPYKFQNLRITIERYGIIMVFVFIFILWPMASPFIGFLFKLFTGIAF
jgi:Zn-dependent protease